MKKLLIGILMITVLLNGCSADSLTESEYLDFSNEISRIQSGVFNVIDELILDSNLGDPRWEKVFIEALDVISESSIAFIEKEGVPKDYKEFHKEKSKAMRHFINYTTLMEEGIKKIDADIINESLDELFTAIDYLNSSKKLMPQ